MSDTTNHILPFQPSSSESTDTVDSELFKRFETAELERRTEWIALRDTISTDQARSLAQSWLASDLGKGQIAFPIDKHTYCIHYLRKQQTTVCKVIHAEIEGKLHDWPVVHAWLTEVIQKQSDALCERVVTFYDVTESLNKPTHQSDVVGDSQSKQQDMIKLARIAELERQLKALRNPERSHTD